ncbi:LuxR C-terminal-related transcriptional regulator [Ktedonospora formicarum]|uniref:Helix-turn-helix transcriptional regulator n=1 Tax=Ktedonospora formicarum TaxID=2778364 RepID=A0A8J3MRD5_9CHLR|nr:LuxR C-terminal-related transcriptional regulator [Ktedonospora formicarum]GHO45897.1 helix-turn-helix transcriptional regulator [Ktedonospora formicarum]
MPKSAQYSLDWSPEQESYLLTEAKTGISLLLDEAGEAWLVWLEEHRSFAFHGRSGQLNLLKELRRNGEGYWYAYQRQASGMVKRYLGRSHQVRVERLEEIAIQLAESAQPVLTSPDPLRNSTKSVASQTSQTRKRKQDLPSSTSVVPVLMESKPVFEQTTPMPAHYFDPLLVPKLEFPRSNSTLLPRPHLWEFLDKCQEYKLTLLSGPAGYGKTTLVGQWITARKEQTGFHDVAYLTLDEDDNDPIRFWRYVIAACQAFREHFGREALELLYAHRLPPFKPLETMLVTLLNELSHLDRPALLVLDDVQVIDSPQVIASLTFFLEHLPSSFHLMLLTRGEPPFSLVRFYARNEVLDLYPPALRFTLDETRAFFAQELSFPLSQKVLRQIDERLDGWLAGLRLLTREIDEFSSEEDMKPVLARFTGSHWSVREYFLSEVVHTLPADQRMFLFQTCHLPRLQASLCQAITGREDCDRMLTALHAGDRFLIRMDREGKWARYHTLFARSMQEEARKHLGDEQIRQLTYRASIWYEEHDFLDDAIDTTLDAEVFSRAASLIERFILAREQSNVLQIPELYSMQRWLGRLPQEELESLPILCLHYAMVRLFWLLESPRIPDGDPYIQHLLQIAEEHWRDTNNTTRLASVFAFRALLARQEGKLLQAITWARQSLVWLPPEERVWRNIGLTVVGHGELLEGNLDQARSLFHEALALSNQLGNVTYARATRGMLAGVNMEYGEMNHAFEQLSQLQAEAREQEDYDDIAHSQLGLAKIAYQRNKLDEAEYYAQEVMDFGEQLNQDEFLAYASIYLALIEQARGQAPQARQRLTSWLARNPTPVSHLMLQLSREIQTTLASLQLMSGLHTPVEHWFASLSKGASKLPLLQQRCEQLLSARWLLTQGDLVQATQMLEELECWAVQTKHFALSHEVRVLLVLACARQSRIEQARVYLCDLLAASLNEGYVRLFLDAGEELTLVIRDLLPSLREKNLAARARYLLEAAGLSSNHPARSLLNDPLSSQERKVLRLLAAGCTNAEIARELVVSVNTVRTQLQSIYRKLNVSNRVEASTIANQLELL